MAAKGKTWPQFVASLIIHELVAKRIAFPDVDIFRLIALLEYRGITTRQETRRWLAG